MAFWDSWFKKPKKRGFDKRIDKLTQELYDQARNIRRPELEELQYQQLQSAGNFDPELLQGLQSLNPEMLGDSRLGGVNFDPRLMGMQEKTLQALMEIGEKGGLRPEDEAALDRVLDSVAVQDKGRRDSIIQSMATRGMGGSGNELLAMLQSNQAASDRANDSGLQIAGDASQRALQSLIQGGEMARDMSNDQLNLDMNKASAADQIALFNTQTKNSAQEQNARIFNDMREYNTRNKNDARMFNLQQQQDQLRYNNQLNKQQLDYNKRDRIQQNYENTIMQNQNVRDAAKERLNFFKNEHTIDLAKKSKFERVAPYIYGGAKAYVDAKTGGAYSAAETATSRGR